MKKYSLAVIILLILSIGIVGCQLFSKDTKKNQDVEVKVEDTTISFNLEEENGKDTVTIMDAEKEDTKITFDTSKEVGWPIAIPSIFPKLSGTLVSMLQTSQDEEVIAYTFGFKDISDLTMEAYADLLENTHGWTIVMKSITNDGWVINATHEKQNAFLMATVYDQNMGAMQISYDRE